MDAAERKGNCKPTKFGLEKGKIELEKGGAGKEKNRFIKGRPGGKGKSIRDGGGKVPPWLSN